MIKVYTIIIAILFTLGIFGQPPQKMSYQAVIRNSSDQLVTNHAIGMRISILQGSATGTPVYVETQTPNTNENGLVTIEIGGGTSVTGTFVGIDWSAGIYFIKTETDPTGLTNYSITGTSQLLSVPYALYSLNANNVSLTKNSRQSNLYVKDDGSLWVIPNISVEKPYGAVPTVIDADGNTYSTVKIGTQVWMSENLKTTKFNDNTGIPLVTNNTTWAALTSPAYCWYNNDAAANKNTYGALYNWYTVITNKLCPTGWHVPTDSEWTTLITYLGSLAGGRLKESGILHWNSPNTEASNDSKFTALPGSGIGNDGYGGVGFAYIGQLGRWWSSTESGTTNAWNLLISNDYCDASLESYNRIVYGFSVRCLKD